MFTLTVFVIPAMHHYSLLKLLTSKGEGIIELVQASNFGGGGGKGKKCKKRKGKVVHNILEEN